MTERVATPQYVLDAIGTWADPESPARELLEKRVSHTGPLTFDDEGLPQIPTASTGKSGRLLGKWGPNHAADPVILFVRDDVTYVLLIKRKDTGLWALPGGMVDAGERASKAAARELKEEAGVELDMSDAVCVFRGVVEDDPRNTDNAWMETAVYVTVLDEALAANIDLNAGDDASDARWVDAQVALASGLYADHARYLKLALEAS